MSFLVSSSSSLSIQGSKTLITQEALSPLVLANLIPAVHTGCPCFPVFVSGTEVASFLFSRLFTMCLFMLIQVTKWAQRSFRVSHLVTDFILNKAHDKFYQETSSSSRGTVPHLPVRILGQVAMVLSCA